MKRLICCIMLVLVTACFPMAASAEEIYSITSLETDDESLIAIAEELMSAMELKAKFRDIFSDNDEIIGLESTAEELFSEPHTETYVIPIDFEKTFASFVGDYYDEIQDLGIDEKRMLTDGRLGNTAISYVNASVGTTNLAATTIMATSRSYVADLDQEIIVILEYDNYYSVAADFFPSGDHVMTVAETLIPTETIPLLQEILSGIIPE